MTGGSVVHNLAYSISEHGPSRCNPRLVVKVAHGPSAELTYLAVGLAVVLWHVFEGCSGQNDAGVITELTETFM